MPLLSLPSSPCRPRTTSQFKATRPLIWLVLVVLAAGLLMLFPDWSDPAWWVAQRNRLGPMPWLALLTLQCLCALLMLPSLPLVIASAMLWPQQPLSVLTMALAGVLLSALLIHGNARWLGLQQGLKGQRHWRGARRWIGRHGSPALCLWCMAPFLPSDLGCYVAAAARMPLRRFLPAVLIGESVLCASVIWGARAWAG